MARVKERITRVHSPNTFDYTVENIKFLAGKSFKIRVPFTYNNQVEDVVCLIKPGLIELQFNKN